MTDTYINTPFVITDNQTDYPPNQIWVSFAGKFTNTGVPQTIGWKIIKDFESIWRSFSLQDLFAPVPELPYFDTQQYTFSLNDFSGRIYINYGETAPAKEPNPGAPGPNPYIVFEATVSGRTLPPPVPSASNMDLSYVDGVSAPAGTMIRGKNTGDALQATSVNPVTSKTDIIENVAASVPAEAQVKDGETIVRIMSSAAAPSVYHNWDDLMQCLQQSTENKPLGICSYTASASGIPSQYALDGALFGYSGAPEIPGQAPGFENRQDYVATAIFMADLNPQNIPALTQRGIPAGTDGVVISGTGVAVSDGGTPAGSFNIYITQRNLNAGTGIYGSNPPYVVAPESGSTYSTNGIVNDLGGRIVGDLMAGMVFGWAASTVSISEHAADTDTDLYGMKPSAETVGGLSTGELFFLLSLAGAQDKLTDWIGPALDVVPEHYDQYLYAIAMNSNAYGSAFTDRLQGYSNPDTYWYTANPPAIPGEPSHYEVVGFVDLYLGYIPG